MFWVILISFCVASAARDYRVTKTDTEYTFDIAKRFARAYYDEQKHQLNIKAIGFDRTWNLPSDANGKKAKTFRQRSFFQVVVPRERKPLLKGGEVPRGTIIRLMTSDICLTTDGSEPVCGSFKKCHNGISANEFTVNENDVIVKVRSCKYLHWPIQQAHYSAFDTDIEVEEVFEVEEVEDNSEKGQGWFDRHGRERPY